MINRLISNIYVALFALACLLGTPRHAAAEGSAQVGTFQDLRTSTAGMAVYIADHTVETITWTGNSQNAITITRPDGTGATNLDSVFGGASTNIYDPTQN